jgi:hypothetical protein
LSAKCHHAVGKVDFEFQVLRGVPVVETAKDRTMVIDHATSRMCEGKKCKRKTKD